MRDGIQEVVPEVLVDPAVPSRRSRFRGTLEPGAVGAQPQISSLNLEFLRGFLKLGLGQKGVE